MDLRRGKPPKAVSTQRRALLLAAIMAAVAALGGFTTGIVSNYLVVRTLGLAVALIASTAAFACVAARHRLSGR